MRIQPITNYSVVYSIDFDGDYKKWLKTSLNPPPEQLRKYEGRSRLWELTDHGKSEYGIPGFRHRKWAAVLSPAEFREFVNYCNLYSDSTQTMGTIGCPGFGFGWCPAVLFGGGDNDAMCQAYVTPVPFWPEWDDRQRPLPIEGLDQFERTPNAYWDELQELVVAAYEDGPPYEGWENTPNQLDETDE